MAQRASPTNRSAREIAWGALLLLAGAAVSDAGAATNVIREVRVGVLNHDTDGLWSGIRRENGTDINVEVIFARTFPVPRGTLRPAVGGTFSTSGDTSKIYACGRWEYEFQNGAFFALGVGAALHNGKTGAGHPGRKALGSAVLFHLPFEFGYTFTSRQSVSLYFDHMSNAGFADENEGMDTLGVRYGVRF